VNDIVSKCYKILFQLSLSCWLFGFLFRDLYVFISGIGKSKEVIEVWNACGI